MRRNVGQGFGGADADLDAALDTYERDLAELVSIADARQAGLVDVDPLTALQSKLQAWTSDRNVMLPVALGAVALGVLLLLPEGGRRR